MRYKRFTYLLTYLFAAATACKITSSIIVVIIGFISNNKIHV